MITISLSPLSPSLAVDCMRINVSDNEETETEREREREREG
jgi:hypothetical protein